MTCISLVGGINSAYATPTRIDIVDFQRLTDRWNDGTVDLIEDGYVPRGARMRLNYTAGVLNYEPLSFPIGTYSQIPFFEYDISDLTGVVSATINFTRFFSNAWERLGQIRVSGYAADGVVTIADYGALAQLVGVTDPTPSVGTSQPIAIDITDFLKGQTSRFVGFRFDMTVRGGARFLDNTYLQNISDLEGWLASTPVPYLSIETTTVPEPTTLVLLGVGLAGLRYSRRRSAQKTKRFCPSGSKLS